jgi:hypothetical protein
MLPCVRCLSVILGVFLVLLACSPAWSEPAGQDQFVRGEAQKAERKESAPARASVALRDLGGERTNALRTLESSNGLEVVNALSVLLAQKAKGPEVAQKVTKCYLANATNSFWAVPAQCILVLNVSDDPAAVEFAKRGLRELPIDGRLYLARSLTMQGKLFGYPVLKDALLSTNAFFHMLGTNAVEEFRRFNGQVWNEAGDRIDVDGLIREVESFKPKR